MFDAACVAGTASRASSVSVAWVLFGVWSMAAIVTPCMALQPNHAASERPKKKARLRQTYGCAYDAGGSHTTAIALACHGDARISSSQAGELSSAEPYLAVLIDSKGEPPGTWCSARVRDRSARVGHEAESPGRG